MKPGTVARSDFGKAVREDARSQGNAARMISRINPVLRGWASRCQTVVSKRTFTRSDSYLARLTFTWVAQSRPARRRFPGHPSVTREIRLRGRPPRRGSRPSARAASRRSRRCPPTPAKPVPATVPWRSVVPNARQQPGS